MSSVQSPQAIVMTRPKSPLLLCAALAVLAALGAWLAWRAPRDAPQPGQPATTSPARDAAAADSRAEDRLASELATAQQGDADSAKSSQRVLADRARVLRLRAIDPDGNPVVGVELAIRLALPDSERQARADSLFPTPLPRQPWVPIGRDLRTGADGRLEVPFERPMFFEPSERLGPPLPLVITPVILGLADPRRVTVSLEPWPADEILVPIPATGEIVVKRIGVETAGEQVELELAQRGHSASRDQQELGSAGEARFTRVALGQEWRASLSIRRSIQQKFRGPIHPGQTVTCILDATYAPHELRLRVVDGREQPLRDREVQIGLDFEDAAAAKAERTDADGIAVVRIHDAVRDLILESMELACELPSSGLRAEALVEIGRKLPPGVTDLGTIVLVAPGLIGAGRIDGVDAAILRDASTILEAAEGTDPHDGSMPWRRVTDAELHTTADGAFTLHATAKSERFRLSICAERVPPTTPIEFVRGTRDLRIEVVAPGALELPVRVDPAMALTRVLPLLVPLRGQPTGHASRAALRWNGLPSSWRPGPGDSLPLLPAAPADPGENFRWHALAPGAYRLEVYCSGHPRPLEVTPAIELVSGETTTLPELDLRGRVRKVRVQLRSADESRFDFMRQPLLAFCDERPGRPWQGILFERADCELLLFEPTDVMVLALGFEPQRVRGLFADQEIVLTPWPELRVRIDAQHAGLAADVELDLRFEVVGATTGGIAVRTLLGTTPLEQYAEPSPRAPSAGADGLFRTRVPTRVTLRFRLTAREPGGNRIPLTERIEPDEIHLTPDSSRDVTLVVGPPR